MYNGVIITKKMIGAMLWMIGLTLSTLMPLFLFPLYPEVIIIGFIGYLFITFLFIEVWNRKEKKIIN